MSRPLPAGSPLRERRVAEITAHYDALQLLGFPVTLEGNAETLQVARTVDQTNWLTVYTICTEGVAYEAALAELDPEFEPNPAAIFLQTTSNTRYFMTYSAALTIIRDLRAWGILSWQNWNRLKDLARDPAQTPTAASLEALNLDEGWP